MAEAGGDWGGVIYLLIYFSEEVSKEGGRMALGRFRGGRERRGGALKGMRWEERAGKFWYC